MGFCKITALGILLSVFLLALFLPNTSRHGLRRNLLWSDPTTTIRKNIHYPEFVGKVSHEFKKAPKCDDSDPHCMEFSFPLVSREGMWLEFGVFSGGTIKQMAKAHSGKPVYGFDSFEGLPEQWRDPNHMDPKWGGKGAFSLDGKVPFPETDTIKWVKGWFDNSLPEFLSSKTTQDKLAYLHIDCDLYSSTKEVFKHLGPWLKPGVIIVFDELLNYAGFEHHEMKAFFELILHRSDLDFVALGSKSEAAVMKLISSPV